MITELPTRILPFNAKLKTCVCVGCGGGGGGVRKQFLVKENQVMELWRLESDPPDPVSDVITIPPLTF